MRPGVAAVLACAALVACGSEGSPSASPSPSVTTAAPTTPAPDLTTFTPTPAPTATPPTDLADGKHYGYLKAFDRSKRTVTIDVVQFLTGAEGEKAARDDGEEFVNDYYIRNTNTRLRVLTFEPATLVVVNTLTAEETGSATEDTQVTHAKFASYFANGQAQERMFYVTLSGGAVTKINEQFLP